MSVKCIRILRVVGRMDPGGIETSIMHALRRMDRQRFRTDFLYVEPAGRSRFDDELHDMGARIAECPKRNPFLFSSRFRRIAREAGPYHVMHASLHRFNGYVARAAESAGIPVRVVHSHSDTSAMDEIAGTPRRWYIRLQNTLIRRHATLGLAVSRAAAASLYGDGWDRDGRWRVLYQGRDLSEYELDVDQEALRRELKIPPGAYVLGNVGRILAKKNPFFLLEVLAAARRLDARAHLLMVGSGDLQQAVAARARARGLWASVTMTGDRADVPRLLRTMDVFVLPSLREGLPMAMIEAQAAGLPCLVADHVTGEADVVPPLLRRMSLDAPHGDWAAAALAPRRIPRARALELVKASPFHIDTHVRALEALYEEQLGGAREAAGATRA